jgi:hypothetical protein
MRNSTIPTTMIDRNSSRAALTASPYTEGNRAVHDHLADWRMSLERDFTEHIERGIADGDVPAGADAVTIAAFYNTVNPTALPASIAMPCGMHVGRSWSRPKTWPRRVSR